MGLNVGLVIDIETNLVAKLVELPVLRIVAETYRIDIVGLHQFQVLATELPRHIMSGMLVMLVDIDSLELDRLAVHQENIATEFESAEADIERNHLSHIPVTAQGYEKAVEVRGLGSPFQDIGKPVIEAEFRLGARLG